MMKAGGKSWMDYWHTPVALVRPYLFLRGFMLLLAVDAWSLLAHRSSAYGFGGFNVAHFGWLDMLQPLPTPWLYGTVQFLVGFSAFFVALSNYNRPAIVSVFGLYTYGWSMSLTDSYQHHYLISIVLFCLAFFPELRGWASAPPVRSKIESRLGEAWAYRMLGATIAIVYFYTSIAKCDATWLAGDTLQYIDQSSGLMSGIGRGVSLLGIDAAIYWPAVSAGVILVELFIAVGYVLTLSRDVKRSRWLHLVCWTAFALACGLHGSFELLELEIGLFSYYMLMTACVFFLPEPLVSKIAIGLDTALGSVDWFANLLKTKLFTSDYRAALFSGVAAAVCVVVCGYTIELPGASTACGICAFLVVASLGVLLVRQRPAVVHRSAVIVAAGALTMWTAIGIGSAQYLFYMGMAGQYLEIGQPDKALAVYAVAEKFVGEDRPRRGQWLLNMDAALQAKGESAESVRRLREAIELDPTSPEAHYNLGLVLIRQGDLQSAEASLTKALDLDPVSVDSLVNLANISLARGDIQTAIERLNKALMMRPNYAEARYNLGNVYLHDRNFENAIEEYRRALQIDPELAAAQNNLGNVYFQQGKLDQAEAAFRIAVQIDPMLPSGHCSLGNVSFKRGEFEEARRHYETALQHDPQYDEAKHNLRIVLRKSASGRYK